MEEEKEIIISKDNVKKYFFPVYWIWALIIPTILIILNAYLNANGSIFDEINWGRIPAMFALFGLIYPLTLVIFPGFYMAFTTEHGYTFVEAVQNMGTDEMAKKVVIAVVFFTISWLGPLAHLTIAFIKHKKSIDVKYNKTVSWIDYLYGFI